ncbi:MAG TPA: hypothetical protein PK020_08470 [Ilumatobacteraceae bacterium]|nr:hypothetical protein [Ilumatobacteraceae bacterium]
MSKKDTRKDDGRTTAEWTTFIASCVVLVAVIGLIVAQLFGTSSPPAPQAEVRLPYRVEASSFHVTVEVSNHGDKTAANVQVTATLAIDGETTTADQTIDFLAGDATKDLVFVFNDDPTDGTLTVAVSSYSLP